MPRPVNSIAGRPSPMFCESATRGAENCRSLRLGLTRNRRIFSNFRRILLAFPLNLGNIPLTTPGTVGLPGEVVFDSKDERMDVVKKLIALVLAVAFLVGTIGCSGGTSKSGGGGSGSDSGKGTGK